MSKNPSDSVKELDIEVDEHRPCRAWDIEQQGKGWSCRESERVLFPLILEFSCRNCYGFLNAPLDPRYYSKRRESSELYRVRTWIAKSIAISEKEYVKVKRLKVPTKIPGSHHIDYEIWSIGVYFANLSHLMSRAISTYAYRAFPLQLSALSSEASQTSIEVAVVLIYWKWLNRLSLGVPDSFHNTH